jgi:Ca-activated chloride channel homolog
MATNAPTATTQPAGTSSTVGASAVQVAVQWGDQVLEVRSFQPPCCLRLADAPARLSTTLVRDLRDGSQAILDFPTHDRGRLLCVDSTLGSVRLDGVTRSLKEAGKPIDATDEIEVELPRGARLTVQVGPVKYLVTIGPAVSTRGFRSDWRWSKAAGVGLLATTVVHAGAIMALSLLSPPLGLNEQGVTDEQVDLMRRYLRASAEREVEAKEETGGHDEKVDHREGGSGTRARGEEGSMGIPSEPSRHNYGVAGPAGVGGDANAPNGASFGLIGVLNSAGGADSSPWGTTGHGAGTGSGPGFDSGQGGLGLSGIGEGGGSRGEGIGLGSIGTIGHGAGTGTGQGFGSGHGRLGGSHRTRPPSLRFPSGGFSVDYGAGSKPVAGSAPPDPSAGVNARAPTPTAPAAITEEAPIDPNGRFATTYRPGGGHLAAFDAAVARGVIPIGHRALVASIGGGHAPDVPLNPDRAMAFVPSLERSQLPPSGGPFHLRFAMRSAPNAPNARPRLSVHLVLDTSGSMQGHPIAHARDAARAVVDQLHPTDDFSLVTFASEGHVRVEDGPVGPRRNAIQSVISGIWADGGTNLGEGLERAYAQASKKSIPEDAVRVVLVVSDGRANEGITGSSQLSRMAVDAFQAGIQTSTFGVGVDYDGPLMSRIASDGAGGYYYLPASDQIATALTSELDKRLRPVATALEIRIRLRHGVELLHVYGSQRLSESASSRVRATEVAADQHAEKRDGIRSNRQNDLEGGMRFFIPAFAADERHALLLKLRVPAGVKERGVGVIEVRYKDRLAKQNRSDEYPIVVAYANDGAASAQTIDRSVTRTIQGYMAGESLLAASRYVAEGRHEQALAALSEREIILRKAAAQFEDPVFFDDAARLTRIRSHLDPRTEPLALAMLLEAAGRSAL